MMVIITCSSFGIFINTFNININFITFGDKTNFKYKSVSTLDISVNISLKGKILT